MLSSEYSYSCSNGGCQCTSTPKAEKPIQMNEICWLRAATFCQCHAKTHWTQELKKKKLGRAKEIKEVSMLHAFVPFWLKLLHFPPAGC
mmetsp:Transcript_47056/g.87405  ORF Transcript_47056/g.87405 Transcript_47056/m.87405 type:complete len:89 (-) Transcript_47056:633-899(-)